MDKIKARARTRAKTPPVNGRLAIPKSENEAVGLFSNYLGQRHTWRRCRDAYNGYTGGDGRTLDTLRRRYERSLGPYYAARYAMLAYVCAQHGRMIDLVGPG